MWHSRSCVPTILKRKYPDQRSQVTYNMLVEIQKPAFYRCTLLKKSHVIKRNDENLFKTTETQNYVLNETHMFSQSSKVKTFYLKMNILSKLNFKIGYIVMYKKAPYKKARLCIQAKSHLIRNRLGVSICIVCPLNL